MCLLRCGAHIAQWTLLIVNLLLSLIGLGVVGLGIYLFIQVNQVNVADLNGNELIIGPVIVTAVGAIFTAIFFCGCCGAFYRNKCLLITYSLITLLLATLTVFGAITIFNNLDKVKEITDQLLASGFENEEYQDLTTYIEAGFGCCGSTGPESYSNSTLPISCCSTWLQNAQQETITPGYNISIDDISSGSFTTTSCSISNANQIGCVEIFSGYIVGMFKTAGNVLIAIIVIEYTSAFFAILLSCSSRKK